MCYFNILIMNYKLKFLVKNKLKQLVQFYIKLKV